MFEKISEYIVRKCIPLVSVLIVFFSAINAYSTNQMGNGGVFFSVIIGMTQGVMIAAFLACFFYTLLSIRTEIAESNRLTRENIKCSTMLLAYFKDNSGTEHNLSSEEKTFNTHS